MERTDGRIKSVAADGGEKLLVLGDEIFVKLSGEDTGGAFAVIEELTSPLPASTNSRHLDHRHPRNEAQQCARCWSAPSA